MKREQVNFKANVEEFLDKIQYTFVDRVILSLEKQPSFDKVAVPFKFDYSFFAIIVTEKSNFKVIAAATTEGMETFWIEQFEGNPKGDKAIEIGSTIKSIELGTAWDFQYPFKMSILFED